ncbi:MAG: GNAT family N-acetyltransferase [Chloroflexi bacterium]|nr:GNAT family N-acetyltransferase [Chloroflexota bacterium]MCI0580805.1 GNAT family N-acetyltransferase [Chloroflexota bacterium]MCI0648451.1 GNAT family N-acetyltransferase [Chloroflexota bacterium]MCI0727581.1 GNAT family N-acetyltransferase [Chloroflexota bacterium]
MNNLFAGRLVRLRALEPDDAETLFQHLQDTEISRLDSSIEYPRSLADIRRLLENPREARNPDNRELAIETLDGQMVGGINVQGADSRNGTFSIGIGLPERTAWGKGYAKEAMLLALRYMFHERRYQKCNIGVFAFNERAIGLYRHLGFVDEGRVRRAVFTNSAYHDEILLGMTFEEFDNRYPEWRVSLDENSPVIG